MPLRRSRGPYAPQRQPVFIDWEAERAASARARAEEAAVNEQARRNIEEFRLDADPINQLVKRCAGIDLRQDTFDQRLKLLEDRTEMIIDMLKERDGV